MFTSPPYWKLEEALTLIRGLQPEVRKLGYRVCLGGEVLNKGESKNDLDLYFISRDNPRQKVYPDRLVRWLSKLWGSRTDIDSPADEKSIYDYAFIYWYGGLGINVFITIGGASEEVREDISDIIDTEMNTAPTNDIAETEGNPFVEQRAAVQARQWTGLGSIDLPVPNVAYTNPTEVTEQVIRTGAAGRITSLR